MPSQQPGTVRRADQPGDFTRFGVDPNRIAPAEDGRRIGTEPHHFEWWYADALLDNGSIGVAVIFFTKPFTNPQLPLMPVVSISLKFPDAAPETRTKDFAAEEFTASEQSCDVRIGGNRFSGDLDRYVIEADVGGWAVKLDMQRLVPSLRLGTGHQLFERAGADHYFAWLPSVPVARVKAEIAVDGGKPIVVEGFGYHDHNWGDTDMSSLIHHWYWARAQVGPYTVIAANITAQPAYGDAAIPVFILLENGAPVAVGDPAVVFSKAEEEPDPTTGKLVAKLTSYSLDVGDARYVVSFRWTETLVHDPFTPHAPPDPEIGGAYHRFKGVCTLQKISSGTTTELPPAVALWELMFFGSRPDPRLFEMVTRSLAMARAY